MVSREAVFWPLSKRSRNSLKGPAYHVLSYLLCLSGHSPLSFSLSVHPPSLPSPHKAGDICFAGMRVRSSSAEQQAPASCRLPPQRDEEFCPGTKYLIPVLPCPCPGSSSPGPGKASTGLLGHIGCHPIQTRAAPEARGSRREQGCRPCGPKGKSMSFVTSGRFIPYRKESLKNISKVSDPVYELV